jgi:hypothetical protein
MDEGTFSKRIYAIKWMVGEDTDNEKGGRSSSDFNLEAGTGL